MKAIQKLERMLKNLKPGEYIEMPKSDELIEILASKSDPTGRNANEPGAKLDANKNRMGLVLGDFSAALNEVSKVGTIGANKYSAHGWLSVPDGVERYTDAMLRHYFKEATGELLDPELTELGNTPVHHAACVAWNALARLQLILNAEKSNE